MLFMGKSTIKWPFSIAMLNYQRVYFINSKNISSNARKNVLVRKSNILATGWWFQPLRKILVNGKDYPIYCGK